MGQSAIAAALLKFPARVKRLVFTQHFIYPASSQSSLLKKNIANLIFRLSFAQYNQLFAISTEVRDTMIARHEVNPKKIRILYNGIEGVSGEKIQHQPFNILIVSRLSKEKGIIPLLNVLAEMLKEKPSFSVTIVGDGEEKSIIRQQINEWQLQDNIVLAGKSSNINEYYLKADLLINATKYEAFGLVIVEAMSAQLPVIAFNQGGPRDILINETTGYLIQSFEQIKEKVQILIDNPELRETMGKAGYKRFTTHFALNIMMNELIKEYGLE